MRRMTALIATASLCPALGACGNRVSGHAYHSNGGVIQIEFRPDGRAHVSAGATIQTCRYSESGKLVSLSCNNNTTNFTVQDDGALVGPDGPMARLTPVQN